MCKQSAKQYVLNYPRSGDLHPPVHLEDCQLSCAECHKYLGLYFDPQLSWDIHVMNKGL